MTENMFVCFDETNDKFSKCDLENGKSEEILSPENSVNL